jgi:uncharacterized Zn finger protein (UPF0148 family)
MLTRGGTLTNEACTKCGGVQIKFGGKKICINCGREIKIDNTGIVTTNAELDNASSHAMSKSSNNEQEQSIVRGSLNLPSAASFIEQKIALVAREIRTEDDIQMQKKKAKLLKCYLEIFEKMKNLAG